MTRWRKATTGVGSEGKVGNAYGKNSIRQEKTPRWLDVGWERRGK
jgi:hypothetical protein